MCLDSCIWIICEISIVLVIVHSLDTRSTFVSKNKVVYTEQELWTIFRQQGKPVVTSRVWSSLKHLGIRKPQRWSRGGKTHKSIPAAVPEPRVSTTENVNNAASTETSAKQSPDSAPKLRVGLLNARSICNKKKLEINDYIQEQDIDIMCVTETWLTGTPRDNAPITAVKPPGYQIKHVPRTSRKGGGVGMIYREDCTVKLIKSSTYRSFEHMTTQVVSGSSLYHISVIYRPPPSVKNKLTFARFMDEFPRFLVDAVMTSGQLLIIGDF